MESQNMTGSPTSDAGKPKVLAGRSEWINSGPVTRCPYAPEGKTHSLYYTDGAHNYEQTAYHNCVTEYVCKDCGLKMSVDSGD